MALEQFKFFSLTRMLVARLPIHTLSPKQPCCSRQAYRTVTKGPWKGGGNELQSGVFVGWAGTKGHMPEKERARPRKTEGGRGCKNSLRKGGGGRRLKGKGWVNGVCYTGDNSFAGFILYSQWQVILEATNIKGQNTKICRSYCTD